VCELLRANLYEFQKYNKETGEELYFTNARIQKIATSVLKCVAAWGARTRDPDAQCMMCVGGHCAPRAQRCGAYMCCCPALLP
jgi:hypothetical protein